MKIEEANKILQVVSENKSVKLSNSDMDRISEARQVFVSFYKSNPKAFIEDFILILDGNTNEEVVFRLNKAQQLLVEALMDGERYLAAPKARQLGITTLTNALALWHSMFTNNANVICMAVKADNAAENLRRIKTMFRKMPEWVQGLLVETDESIHSDNQSLWSFRSKMTGTDNKIEVSSAGSEDSTRGKTPTFLHWTETAFADKAKEIFTSVYPALQRRKDSIIILESTGNGNSGFYYEVCVGKRKGFKVIFLPWFLEEDYTTEGDDLTESDLDYIKDLMGVDEIPGDLTEGQLRWYRATSEATGKLKGQQEYPINVEQVFQATNSSFFSWKTINKIQPKPPEFFMVFENGFLTRRTSGPGRFYHVANPEYEYLISCDPSEGVVDFTSIGVYDPEGREVCLWHEKREAEEVAELLVALGNYYNGAKVVVESNGIGHAVLNSMIYHRFYTNIHREGGKPGFRVNGKDAKAHALSLLQSMINEGTMKFNNEILPEEMGIFEAETLKATKGEGNHDDCIMQAAIASFVFKHNPPKKKFIRQEWADYSYATGEKKRTKRRFIF